MLAEEEQKADEEMDKLFNEDSDDEDLVPDEDLMASPKKAKKVVAVPDSPAKKASDTMAQMMAKMAQKTASGQALARDAPGCFVYWNVICFHVKTGFLFVGCKPSYSTGDLVWKSFQRVGSKEFCREFMKQTQLIGF